MRKILVLLVIVSSISTLNASSFGSKVEAEKAYDQQVEVNYYLEKDNKKLDERNRKISEEHLRYKNTAIRNIDRCEMEKKQLKKEVDEGTQWLVRIPFTKIGITVPFAQGFLSGVVVAVVIL